MEEAPGGCQEIKAAKKDTVASGSLFLFHLHFFVCDAEVEKTTYLKQNNFAYFFSPVSKKFPI